jgi:hypothetical protein
MHTLSKAAFLLGGLAASLLPAEVAAAEREPDKSPLPIVEPFSSSKPGGDFPPSWRAWTIGKYKKATQYRLVNDSGTTVVEAYANASASGLSHEIRVDLKEVRWIKWRWRVPRLIAGADNTRKQTEDSPVRIVVTFLGDKSKFSLADKMFAAQVWMLTDYEVPYATLMYIWENRVPKDRIIPNLHTSRIKMIVVESGNQGLGEWREHMRNLYDDYKRAFGEEPPMTRSVGIMTDTDNTGDKITAYYGDIAFTRVEK